MKKIICLLLCAVMIIPVTVVKATDYSGHWAYETIAELIEEQVISGDETGNINPDRFITRAETVKIINKVLNFNICADEGFPDVSEKMWYYKEFLIAKKQGYINGDTNGNANPDAYISRQEVCVMVTRACELEGNESEILFTDKERIAGWASDAVKILYNSGLIKGYDDSTFRPEGFITRAELFTLIKRLRDSKNEESTVKKEDMQIDNDSKVTTTFVPSVSFGGGGSGGSSSSKVIELPSPVLVLLDEDLNFKWQSVKYADSYTVKLSYQDKSVIEENIKTTELNLSDLSDELLEGVYVEKAVIEACVMAVPKKSSYLSSEYSDILTIEKTIIDMNNQAELGLELDYKILEGNEVYKLNFSSDVLFLNITGTDNTTVTYSDVISPFDMTNLISENNGIKSDIFQIVAVSKKGVQKIDVNTDFAGGNGTVENPYIVSNLRHFRNISKYPEMNYCQTGTIDTGENFLNMYQESGIKFSGTYTGEEENTEIKINITDAANYASVFGYLENADIKNLKITGNISGKSNSYTAGLAGYIKDSLITNVTNYSDISASELTENAYIGGITGYVEGETSVISDCNNFGNITVNTGVTGGICGYIKTSASTITECNNYGTVVVTNEKNNNENSPVGGIVGLSFGLVEKSVNAGEIRSEYCNTANSSIQMLTGGIIGNNAGTVSECINESDGKVKSVIISGTLDSSNGAAGQLGGIVGRNYKTTGVVSKCKNYGGITGDTSGVKWWTGGIAGLNENIIELCANLSSDITSRQIGGIVGRTNGGKIEKCYNAGNITTAGGYSGGIAARSDSNLTVSDCFNTGNITCKYGAGLIAYIGSSITVNNFYSAPLKDSSNAIATYIKSGQNISGQNIINIPVDKSNNSLNIGQEKTDDELRDLFKNLEGWQIVTTDSIYDLPQLTDNPYESLAD